MALTTSIKRILFNPWSVLLVVVLAVGAGVYLARDGQDDRVGESGAPRAIPVEVESVRSMTLLETVQGVGTLRATETVEIRPETAGRIRAIHFEEGGMVEQGQLLFELDDEKLMRQLAARRAALRVAEIRVTNAERTFGRFQRAAEQGAVTAEEFDRAREDLDAALAEQERTQAEVELAEAQISDMRLVAPFSGRISERHVDRGAYVSSGDHLATLYQVDPIEIGFSVPDRYIGRIQHGQDVHVLVAAHRDTPFSGHIHFISPAVDEATRTFRVRARIPNSDQRLLPGAFATASVTVDVREHRPVVSAESLVATRTGYIVFVIDNDRAERREVRTGLRENSMVEIIEGVEVGEQVVRTGHLRLSGGELVAVTSTDDPDQAQTISTVHQAGAMEDES
ncbi:MAG TPA: efflux RND transporter periplasmic adaptor subunit [Phycisphaerales bacterium]|nr:efflux RND transporter periplasmic adaptor subunit [Phycisphaerales bacterium]